MFKCECVFYYLSFFLDFAAPPKVEFEDDKNVVVANEGSKIILKCPLKPMAVLPHIIWFKVFIFLY